ncbi:unnamed protein product [Peniophora sp. CBMAI 1063]|nr:unnamed protein product [Peniophora sp. CBMAI 1063]
MAHYANRSWQDSLAACAADQTPPHSPTNLASATPRPVRGPNTPVGFCPPMDLVAFARALDLRFMALESCLESKIPTCVLMRCMDAPNGGDGFDDAEEAPWAMAFDLSCHPGATPAPAFASPFTSSGESTPDVLPSTVVNGTFYPADDRRHCHRSQDASASAPANSSHERGSVGRAFEVAAAGGRENPFRVEGARRDSSERNRRSRDALKRRPAPGPAAAVEAAVGDGAVTGAFRSAYAAKKAAQKARQRERRRSVSPQQTHGAPGQQGAGKNTEKNRAKRLRSRSSEKGECRGRGRKRRRNPMPTPSEDDLAQSAVCVDPSSGAGGGGSVPSSIPPGSRKKTRRNPHHHNSYADKRGRPGYRDLHAQQSAHRRREARERLRMQGGVWGSLHGSDYERAKKACRVIALDRDGNIVLSHCRNGFTGNKHRDGRRADIDDMRSVEELDAADFWGIKWDGDLTYLFLDVHDVIIVAAISKPADDDARPAEERFSALLDRVRCLFEAERIAHADDFQGKHAGSDRGPFPAVNFGTTMGMGQSEPKERGFERAGHEAIARHIMEDEDVQRLAKFGSECFAKYFPLPYYHLRRAMQKLATHDSQIAPVFSGSVYPAACANLGPRTCCRWHHDINNYPGVPCWILALGDYDHRLGGHLVLPQLGIYIEFPPGASVLLSSAGIKHGNTVVQEHETRYSFTQYCPGGLMRWVAYGFRLGKELSDAEKLRLEERAGETWKQQLGRFSTPASLARDRRWVRRQEKREIIGLS